MRGFGYLVFIVAVIGLGPAAHAACVNPAGEAGKVHFNATASALEYCNGAIWIGFPRASGAGSPTYDWSAPSAGPQLDNPNPVWWNPFGAAVAVSGTRIVAGVWAEDGPTNKGIAYVIDALTGTVEHTLANPAPDADDLFGVSVAIDGNLIVVGAEGDDAGASNAGIAYVFDATTGALVSTLTNPAPASGDGFGWSVAISGTVAVIGAMTDDPGGIANAGTAYVFDATTGALIATLNNPNPAADDQFGWRVAISGTTAIVGAPQDDPGGIADAGAAYVFDTATGTLLATFSDPAPTAGRKWGWTVGVSGTTAVVSGGSPHMDTTYAFDTATGAVISTLTKPGDNVNKEYNFVAISGTTALAGAQLEGVGGTAYLFDVATGTVLATLTNPSADPDGGDNFGGGLAIAGGTVVIGAPGDDGVNTDGNTGRAYVFQAQSYCSNPAAPAGSLLYNADHRVLQWCDGAAWQAAGPVDPPGPNTGCTAPAKPGGFIAFNGDHCLLQYCDGDAWRQIGGAAPDPSACDPCMSSPSPGQLCSNGSVYAGLSPDGDVPMFTTPADAGLFAWNDGNAGGYVDTPLADCTDTTPGTAATCRTGQANTATLIALDSDSVTAGIQPHQAAQACADLIAHGNSDWYLPAQDELAVLFANQTAIGGFDATGNFPGGYYLSSSEDSASYGRWMRFGGALQSGSPHTKDNAFSVRCVRR